MVADDDDAQSRSDKPVSALLEGLCGRKARRICVGDILEDGHAGGLPILIAVLAAPNAIPILPPGVVTGTGLVLTPLTALLLVAGKDAKLPGWLSRRGMDQGKFCKAVQEMLPRLRKVEGGMKRRLPVFTGALMTRITGALGLLMAVLILCPIPFANVLTGGALALMALSLVEEEGLWLLGGYGLAALSLGVAYALWRFGGAGWHALVHH